MDRDIPFDCLFDEDLRRLETASREEFLPPLGLADRTCAKLWATIDRPTQRNATTTTLHRFRMLDEILSVESYSEPIPEPTVSAPIASPLRVSGDTRPGKSEGGWRLADLIASIAVGILIAVIAFPTINFAKVRTETMIRQSRMKDIGQSVELYASLGGKHEDDEMSPQVINLAASAWREVNQNQSQLLQVVGGTVPVVGSSLESSQSLFKTVSDRSPLIGERQGQTIFLGQEIPSSTTGKMYRPLLTDIEKAIPVSNGSHVQPAYGQNVLFHDGRVFFRVLPVFQGTD